VLATLPYTLQRFNVSHGIFCPSLGFFACISLPRSLSFFFSLFFSFFFLSLYLSFKRNLFISFLLYLHPSLRNFFLFFLDLVKAALFRISASLLVFYLVCISPKTDYPLIHRGFHPLKLLILKYILTYFYHLQLFLLLFLFLQ